jgi:hypothetical protein
MNTKLVAEALKINSTHLSKRGNVYKLKKSYYWGITKSSREVLEPQVKKAFPNAEIIDSGNHFHPFVGGAKSGSSKDSYYWITFKI